MTTPWEAVEEHLIFIREDEGESLYERVKDSLDYWEVRDNPDLMALDSIPQWDGEDTEVEMKQKDQENTMFMSQIEKFSGVEGELRFRNAELSGITRRIGDNMTQDVGGFPIQIVLEFNVQGDDGEEVVRDWLTVGWSTNRIGGKQVDFSHLDNRVAQVNIAAQRLTSLLRMVGKPIQESSKHAGEPCVEAMSKDLVGTELCLKEKFTDTYGWGINRILADQEPA